MFIGDLEMPDYIDSWIKNMSLKPLKSNCDHNWSDWEETKYKDIKIRYCLICWKEQKIHQKLCENKSLRGLEKKNIPLL